MFLEGGIVNKQIDRTIHVVPYQISDDTISVLQELLMEAHQGKLIGIAYAALYREQQYIVDATGEALRSPTFARGMVAALDDTLGERVVDIT